MPKFVNDMLQVIVALIPLVIDAENPGIPGPEKKAQVIVKICNILDEPGGIDLPTFITGSFRDWLLGLMIDMIVRHLNKTGFFGPSNP